MTEVQEVQYLGKITNNKTRQCYVKEDLMDLDVKNMIYPSLQNIEHYTNNLVCASKELVYRFITEPLIKTRIEKYTASYLPNLIGEYSQRIEGIEKRYKDLKEESIHELQRFFETKAEELDRIINRAYPNEIEDKNKAFLREQLLDRKVFEYNRKAEKLRDERLLSLQEHMQHEIARVFSDDAYTKPSDPCHCIGTTPAAYQNANEKPADISYSPNTQRTSISFLSTQAPEEREVTSVMNEIPTAIPQPVGEVKARVPYNLKILSQSLRNL